MAEVVLMDGAADRAAREYPWENPEYRAMYARVQEGAATRELAGILGRGLGLAAEIWDFLGEHLAVECGCGLCAFLADEEYVPDHLRAVADVMRAMLSGVQSSMPITREEAGLADDHLKRLAAGE